LKGICASS